MAGPYTYTYPLHPAAILLPSFSLISILLEIPPLIWHLRNRNYGAISLITWLFLSQFMSIINPLIWPRDNTFKWWDGQGLCDIEIHVQVAATVGIPGAVMCIVRRLAHILNIEKTTMAKPLGETWQKVLDAWLCVGFPVFIMGIYYIVQPNRYNIIAITGCSWSIDYSWPSIVLVVMWPLILSTINAYLAGLIIFRLLRYRREFSQIVSTSSTTKSRFFRLLFISIIVILAILPQTIYALYAILAPGLHPYRWYRTHFVGWDIVKFPAQGRILVWTGPSSAICGLFVFIAFGLSKDAVMMYRGWCEAIGLGWLGKCLESRRRASGMARGGSMGSSFRTLASKVHLVRSSASQESPTASANRASSYRIPTLDFGGIMRKGSGDILPVYEEK